MDMLRPATAVDVKVSTSHGYSRVDHMEVRKECDILPTPKLCSMCLTVTRTSTLSFVTALNLP